MYGEQPQIMVAAKIQSQAALNVAMATKEWQRLFDNLMKLVDNFTYKVIPSKSGFQL